MSVFEHVGSEAAPSHADGLEPAVSPADLAVLPLSGQDRRRNGTNGSLAPAAAVTEPEPLAVGQVALVDLNPDLAAGLSEQQLQAARKALVIPLVTVPPGRCQVVSCAEAVGGRGLLGAIIAEGLLIGEMWLAGQISARLYGPGDFINCDREQDTSLATTQMLTAPAGIALAILDDRFVAAGHRWPRLAAQFFTQSLRQVDRAFEHQAISQLTRVEDRLLALFWYLADRWGHVRADGIRIDLPLTHETVGRLIGARRPTVTLGLRELRDQQLLHRQADGSWLLATDSLDRINEPERSGAGISLPAQVAGGAG